MYGEPGRLRPAMEIVIQIAPSTSKRGPKLIAMGKKCTPTIIWEIHIQRTDSLVPRGQHSALDIEEKDLQCDCRNQRSYLHASRLPERKLAGKHQSHDAQANPDEKES